MLVVIQPSGFSALMPGAGEAELLAARTGTTQRSTVALAAITMRAEEENRMAVSTSKLAENEAVFLAWIWHAPIAQALDKSKPWLSP